MNQKYQLNGSVSQTEKVGFEPTVATNHTGFQDRHHKPLGHLSSASCLSRA